MAWALLLVLWFSAGLEVALRRPVVSTTLIMWCAGSGVLVIYMLMRRGKGNMQLLKKKKRQDGASGVLLAPDTGDAQTAALVGRQTSVVPGAGPDVVLTTVHKDVFVAHGSHLSGVIEAESNIITEGCIEGSVTSTHQVRVDNGGVVKGDIRAAHIIINGIVIGRCYARAVTLQEQGRIEGDVFTDEFAIERGGVFIGQSCQTQAQTKGRGGDNKPPARREEQSHKGLKPDSSGAADDCLASKVTG